VPIIRALTNTGDSKTVTIPASWIKYAEQQKHKKIVAIAMEVNGSIIISPIFENKKQQKEA
jgi:antitoxin component of MazEF toxin-antitoxin module